jgi:uncharacterized protein DUF3108
VSDRSRGGALVPILILVLASLGAVAPGGGTPPSPGDSIPNPPPAAEPGPGPGVPQAIAGGDSSAGDSSGGDAGVDPGLDPGLALVPWKIGEYFQFSIDWNGLNGGNSLMQVQNVQRLEGRRVYRIVTKTESNSFVSKFYKVRDRAETYIDAESLYSRRFLKHLREGGYKKDVDVRFDQEARKAAYDDGSSFDVPARVHDVLSAFYYVRTRPLPTGATLLLPTHDNKKSYDMEVKVHKRERIQVPAGTFECVLVEPILKSEGVFKSKGSILIWLSDDARRIPVMVKSKVPVGSITVSLTDLRLSFERKR